MSESDRMNETMSFAIMVNVLHALGFVRMNYPQMLVSLRDDSGKRNQPKQRLYGGSAEQDYALAVQLWHTLGGPYYGHVTLNNLRMLLLAIKGLHVEPD